MNLPGISRVTEDNMMLLSYWIKSYMVNPNPHASGVKIF